MISRHLTDAQVPNSSEHPLAGVIVEGLKLYTIDFLSRRYGRSRATRHEFMTRELPRCGACDCNTLSLKPVQQG